MKKRKNKQSNGIVYIGISLLLIAFFVVTVGVSAGQSLNQLLADALADRVAPTIVDSLNLDEPTEEPESMLGGMATDVYYPVHYHEGLYTTVHKDVAFPATSTKNVVGGEANDAMAFYYASRDMICDLTWLDVKSAVGYKSGMLYSFSVGTTTKTAGGSWTNTSTDTIIASTTMTVTDTSDNLGMYKFSNITNAGSHYSNQNATENANVTSTLFLLNAGEYLMANYKTFNVTSTNNWLYNSSTATFNANCWTRS